ncbi:MAG: hypothetical protein HY820_09975 [Acidobacteria bacterium]|nr:hypothetical protein [Acidobacteriota bacterium]
MTTLPVKDVIPPEQALLFVEEIRQRFRIVSLDEDEYATTIHEAAALGLTSGRIYDALLLRCAAKIRAAQIYTWNLKHLKAIAPALSSRIRTP